MKNLISIMFLAFFAFFNSPIEAEPVNYFGIEGTEWLVESISDATPAGPIGFASYKLYEKDYRVNKECLKIWSCYDSNKGDQHIGYISTEGEKVYFLTKNGSEWKLIYDFSLRKDETTIISGCFPLLFNGEDKDLRYIAECEGTNESQEADAPIMNILLKQDNSNSSQDSQDFEVSSQWIQGIGSINGPLENDIMFYVGGGSILIKANSPEKTIYKSELWTPSESFIDNYFGKTGATWTTKYSVCCDPALESVSSEEVYTIKDQELINYKLAHRVYKVESDNTVIPTDYYISVSCGEVYLAGQDHKWRLIYDFDLYPGYKRIVYGGISINNPVWEPKEYEVRCDKIYTLSDYPDIEFMDISIKPYPFKENEGEINQIWIRNIGSINGIFNNDQCFIDGVSVVLETLKYNGQVIYSNKGTSDIDDIIHKDNVIIDNTVKGELKVSGEVKSVRIFDSLGSEYTGNNGHFSQLKPGLYLIVTDSQTVKKFVR